MTIDIVSVVFVIALCGLFLCIATALAVDWSAPEPGARWWIAGFAALALGFFLNGMQRMLPPLVGLTCGTSLIAAGTGMLLIGTQRFLAVPRRLDLWVAAGVVFTVLTSILFWAVWPSVNLRIVTSNLVMALMIAALAWILVRHAGPRLIAPARITAAVAIVLTLLVVLRSIAAWLSPPMDHALQADMINVLVYFAAAMGQLALGLGCYYMLMIRRNVALEALSSIDPLTGAYNRRGLELAVARVEHDVLRHGTPYSVIALDLDHFKRVNDTHGHPAGDVVLRRLAAECRANLRGDSVVARLGGEEFCLLLPGCALDDARAVAERIRHSFETARIQAAGIDISCTVSMGVAQSRAESADFAGVMQQADVALYSAKEQGRNRVAIAVA